MGKLRLIFLTLGLLVIVSACAPNNKRLPYYFPLVETEIEKQSNLPGDYKVLPDFRFINQDGDSIGKAEVEGKIIIADFVFTSCPGICPTLTSNMTQIQEAFLKDDQVQILSFSVDPTYDTPEVLSTYVDKYDIDTDRWMLLTGDREKMYDLIQNGFRLSAYEDSLAPGGIFHDQRFVLLDGGFHFRGYYYGTEQEEIDRLKQDIGFLKREMYE
jgi:protein SCO1/2